MPAISVRKLSILAILAAPGPNGEESAAIVGTTRLQKLLFLVAEALPRVSPDRSVRFDLHFEPYRFGPADLHLYQDLEFLTALGHVSKASDATADARSRPGPEEATEQSLGFAYLMGDEEEAGLLAEVEETVERFQITPRGKELLHTIVSNADGKAGAICRQVLDAAAFVKQQYAGWPLQRLLRYVYAQYPAMTTSSEIRERVLGRE